MDLSVLPRADYYNTLPEQAFLIIEVADSSLERDRGRKAELYAECRVPEYWIVNLRDKQVEVHTAPHEGRYQRIHTVSPGASIQLGAFPDVVLRVDDF